MSKYAQQGGFSTAVWREPYLQDYISREFPGGYVGSRQRTDKKDAFLELTFKQKGMGPRAIAMWLTSTAGRHLGGEGTYEQIRITAEHAWKDVVVWEHPRHTGFLGASMSLKNELSLDQMKLLLHYIG